MISSICDFSQINGGAKIKQSPVAFKLSPASKSFFEALKWYELSSAQNNHKAQNNIGILYYLGDGDSSFKGFKADVKKSLDWFSIAINNGSESAKKNAELAQSNLYGRDDKRLSEIILD